MNVTLPVENPTPGTVIVAVDKDGNETVLTDTRLTENGAEVAISGEYTLKIVDNAQTFDDVSAEDYFTDAVAYLSARNLTEGTSSSTFSPTLSCTRSQLVTLLFRIAKTPESGKKVTFSDVDDGAYYADAVKWATENSIVKGYENGEFGAEDVISREQMAVMLYRFAQYLGMDTAKADEIQNFEDGKMFRITPFLP